LHFIAIAEDTAIRFYQLYPPFSSATLARAHSLNDLYVVEKDRKQGIATMLLKAAVEFAKDHGSLRLTFQLQSAIARLKASMSMLAGFAIRTFLFTASSYPQNILPHLTASTEALSILELSAAGEQCVRRTDPRRYSEFS
jgi:GNAT superfamily N-acetyltransferase